MIAKFFKRGDGSCKATMDYLLGKDRDREHAKVLQGDPEITMQLAESLDFKHKYTVGVLSFEETDLDDHTKQEIMAEFEKSLLCGLEQDQYNICWIEHRDKDRLELNFVIPKVELSTGKAMNPYYDPADRKRVNAFKDHINAKYDLTDPNDPANRQPHTPNMRLPQEKKQLQEAITGYLMNEIAQGRVNDRQGIQNALENDLGLSVARITPTSISIKDPTDEKGRNIRLKGEIYANTFQFSPNYSAENDRASQAYRASRIERISDTHQELTSHIATKRAFNNDRYNRPRTAIEKSNQQDLSLQNSDRGHNGLATGDHNRARDIQSISGQEYIEQKGRAGDHTTEYRPISTTSQSISQSGLGRRKGRDLHSEQEEHPSRNLHQQGQTANFENQIGLLDHAKRLHEQLQQLTERIRATISRIGGIKQQTITTDRAIDRSQSQIERTEREIKQREQTTGNHQRTAEQFTHQVIREIEKEINPQKYEYMGR